ncbi:MAG: type 4a pilus biogenesis protein PilO [Acidobacteriota bacterium]
MKRLDLRPHLMPVLAVLGGLLAANVLVMLLINHPRLAQARNADSTTVQLAARVKHAEARVEELKAKVDELQKNREALEKFFEEDLSTKKKRLVGIQREIYRIASTFQVEASQLKFNHEYVKDSNLVRLTVNIPLSGGYNNLRQFIHHVETSKLFLIIKSIQLQKGEQGGVLLNLNVQLASYFTEGDQSDLRYRIES